MLRLTDRIGIADRLNALSHDAHGIALMGSGLCAEEGDDQLFRPIIQAGFRLADSLREISRELAPPPEAGK